MIIEGQIGRLQKFKPESSKRGAKDIPSIDSLYNKD